ncbi:MAG TPA: M20/M25/M40 family metallo-hydrolase [Tepidisphaeraceae bacterium]|nr:M20/M25/M40 family metallo-hydrolase [Tepidisphaeraceae bacterium]
MPASRAWRASDAAATTTRPTAVSARQALAYLASDELEGRGIGTEGLDRAARFIAEQFQAAGLQPPAGREDYFQRFEIGTAASAGPKTRLATGDRTYTKGEDFTPVGFSAEGTFAGPVVFVGYGMKSDAHHYDDYAGIALKGKVALALRYEPHDEKGGSRFAKEGWSDDASMLEKARHARDAGAAALLIVTPAQFHDAETLMSFSRRAMPDAPVLPIVHVKQTVAEELLRRGGAPDLKSLQQKIDRSGEPSSFALADVEASGQVQIERKKVALRNVIGILPGANHEEYVVVGAHYDHLGRGGLSSLNPRSREVHNGADDNASGTSALIELAHRFARSGTPPPRSMAFVAFTAEEEGLVGSQKFIESPPVPVSQMVAMVNLDMIGRISKTTSPTPTWGSPAPTTGPRQRRRPATTRATVSATRPAATRPAATRATTPASEPTTVATTKATTTAAAATATAETFAPTTSLAHRSPATTNPATTPATQSGGSGILYVGGTGTAEAFELIVGDADRRSPLVTRNFSRGGLGPSDHMTFALKRIPVLFFFSGMHPDYHRPTDDADKINYDGLAQAIDLVEDVVRQIAAAPRQAYVATADPAPRTPGGSGTSVTLGVVPDYSSFDAGGGVKISGTAPGSAAATAGLQPGDVIVKWDDRRVDSLYDLSDLLGKAKPGQKVKLGIVREGKPIEVEATLVARR